MRDSFMSLNRFRYPHSSHVTGPDGDLVETLLPVGFKQQIVDEIVASLGQKQEVTQEAIAYCYEWGNALYASATRGALPTQEEDRLFTTCVAVISTTQAMGLIASSSLTSMTTTPSLDGVGEDR